MRTLKSIAVLIIAALTLFTLYQLLFTSVNWGAVTEWILRGYLLGTGFMGAVVFFIWLMDKNINER